MIFWHTERKASRRDIRRKKEISAEAFEISVICDRRLSVNDFSSIDMQHLSGHIGGVI